MTDSTTADRVLEDRSSPTLERRLRRLERAHARLKRACAAGVLIASAVVLMGQAPSAGVTDVLAARNFQLVDERGRVLASWSATADRRVVFAVLDDEGRRAEALELAAKTPRSSDVSERRAEPSKPNEPARSRLFSWGERDGDESGTEGAPSDFEWDNN